MTKSIVKKSPYSIKLLSLAVVAALSGMSSFSVNSAGDDDELLMFVNLAQPNSATTATKPAAPRPVVAPVTKPAPFTVATPVTKPAPVTVAAPPSVTRVTPAPVSPPRATVPATLETPPAKAKRPKPAANWKLKPANPSNSEGFFNRPTAPVISTAPPVTTSTTTVDPKPAVQPPAAQTSMFHPVLQGSVQTSEAAVKRQESVQQSGSGASYFRQVSPQGEPTLTPMPSVPREVAAPRKHVANAPSEAEIKMLFADAVRQSIRISPRINSSRSQVEAAESSVDEAKGQRWPQVDLTSNSKSLYFGSGTRNGGNKSDIPAVGVNVATTLYDFGQNSNTIKTREEQARAAAVGVAAEEENTAWELSKAMIELNKQRLTIALSEDYVARMKELTAMLSGIVAVDKGRNSELTQAKGRLLSAQSSLDAAVSKARDTEIVIYRLLGESQIALPAAAQWNMSLPNLNAQLARLDLHPTILKAKADAQASLTEAAALRASGLPSLNWVVSKNTGEDEYGRTQAFQTGLQVSWGLFRGGSNTAAERAALARAEANRHLVEEQHRDLEQRVRAANQDAGSMLERADLYQNLKVESDRIRLAFFEQWYHLGKRTLLDVLSAESDYYNNRVSEVNSRFDGYAAIMRSYASSGQLIDWLNSSGR